jgi:hypothetical protein
MNGITTVLQYSPGIHDIAYSGSFGALVLYLYHQQHTQYGRKQLENQTVGG